MQRGIGLVRVFAIEGPSYPTRYQLELRRDMPLGGGLQGFTPGVTHADRPRAGAVG